MIQLLPFALTVETVDMNEAICTPQAAFRLRKTSESVHAQFIFSSFVFMIKQET